MAVPKSLSIEDLVQRNASLHDASKTVFEAIQRYQISLRIIAEQCESTISTRY